MGESVTRINQLIGQMLGPYRVEHFLGEGGMGIVYRAVHLALGQKVAIKVLRRNFSNDEKVLQRFFNEARAVGIVQHPGLVRIHDYQQTQEGHAYIVMELLQGESLDSRLKDAIEAEHGLPLTTVLHLGHQVASALAAAHAAGVVHCDLKPENVFLAPDAEVVGGERAKILDFGIAKFLAESGGKQTTVGLILGTPRYMAPEQCEGRDHLTDKVDVYALGVILYEALAGRAPFVAQSSTGLMRQHMVLDPPPLIEKVPSLPRAVHDLVHAMLAKKPTERPKMSEVAERLQLLKTQPLQPVPAVSAASLVGRRRMAALLISSALFVCAGVGAGVLVSRLRHPEPVRRAEGGATTGLPEPAAKLPGSAVVAPPAGEHPGVELTATHPQGSAAAADAALKAEALRKHKLGKLVPKDGHLHPGAPGEAASVPAEHPSAQTASVAPPTAPPVADPASAKTPAHNKISNGDIEPDR